MSSGRRRHGGSIGDIASKIALNLAFEEDVLAAMLSRWVSELEPFVVRTDEGWLLGLTHVAPSGALRTAEGSRPFWSPPAPLSVRFSDIRLEEIRDHYERRRRLRGFPLRLVENA